jgi:hypothetical protein
MQSTIVSVSLFLRHSFSLPSLPFPLFICLPYSIFLYYHSYSFTFLYISLPLLLLLLFIFTLSSFATYSMLFPSSLANSFISLPINYYYFSICQCLFIWLRIYFFLLSSSFPSTFNPFSCCFSVVCSFCLPFP